MPDLYGIAHQHRQRLLQREAQASATMVRFYSLAARNIEQRVLQLGEQIDRATSSGERVSPSWLFQQERLQSLLTQVQNEIHRFAADAGPLIEGMQREFALAGFLNNQDLITLTRDRVRVATRGAASPEASSASVGVGFGKLASEAAIDLAGFAADGSPLSDLLGALGPAAAAEIKQALFAGVVQGLGAKQLARQVRNALGGNMARAMLIGRTEALRAYRESSQRFYQENSDVVHAWRWVAACNGRTCAVCWAMHGSVHTVDEQFVSHPGCRCTQVPVTDLSPGLATGPARFANLDTETQRRILGPKKFDAYQSGQISLKSLAGMKDNGRWGMTRHERNLADAIAAHRAGTALPIGPMRHRAGAEPPKPPDEPLEVLLPIVEKQLPAATAAEARQRVVGVTEQYAGMLGSIDDELSQIRKVTNWQYAPETKQRAGELIKLRKEVLSARNERTLDVLSVERPANFTANLKTRDKERKALWTKGVESFKRLVGVELEGKTVNLVSIGRRRAHYDLLGTVKLSSDSPLHTVVHELGHWLEDMSPDVHRKTIDFLQRRTAGESTVGLRAFTGQCYARNERAWRDRFMDPYVGKEYRLPFARTQGVDIYRELYATEVVSMGLQWYIEKPAEFAEKDPDFFDFIFNLVRGR